VWRSARQPDGLSGRRCWRPSRGPPPNSVSARLAEPGAADPPPTCAPPSPEAAHEVEELATPTAASLVLVAALTATLTLAAPAHAVEVPGSCNGWETVGSKNIGGYVYTVQARSCVEKAYGAIRAHTGVRFLKSGSATSALPYAYLAEAGVRLYRTPINPQVAANFDPDLGDPGGVSPGPTISGYSFWRCGELMSSIPFLSSIMSTRMAPTLRTSATSATGYTSTPTVRLVPRLPRPAVLTRAAALVLLPTAPTAARRHTPYPVPVH